MPPRTRAARQAAPAQVANPQPAIPPRQFVINVQNFDGDPTLTEFFFSQLEDLVRFNQYSEEQALAILRSKLVGNAMEYYLSCNELKAAQTLAEAKEILVQFFAPSTCKVSANEFNNLKLLPGENIKHLAHRINSLAYRVYPQMEAESLNQIKFVNFLAALPSDTQCKIYEKGINNYMEAVAHAQKVQDAQVASCLTPSVNNSCNYVDQIAQLKEQVNAIQSKPTCQLCDSVNHTARDCFMWGNANNSNSGNNSDNVQNNSNAIHNVREPIKCQFCDKVGHIIRDCFSFKRHQNNSSRSNNDSQNRGRQQTRRGAGNQTRYDRRDNDPYPSRGRANRPYRNNRNGRNSPNPGN